ncbi:MAG: hypothetical protein KME30_02260 [Iphinoe sp. HA4291-MV1]|nr:hypothetical protein [Iphinoe sp. HA4291-MV1]
MVASTSKGLTQGSATVSILAKQTDNSLHPAIAISAPCSFSQQLAFSKMFITSPFNANK